MNIALAKFSLNGEFRSVSSPNLFCDLLTNVKFGVNIEKSCEITAKKLNDMRVEIFEPYLEFVEKEKRLLYAIPVLIRNSNKVRCKVLLDFDTKKKNFFDSHKTFFFRN